jgi:hypothetical protein
MVEWSGTRSSSAIRTNDRIDKLSLAQPRAPSNGNTPTSEGEYSHANELAATGH